MNKDELLQQIEKRLSTVHVSAKMQNVGTVESVGDGISKQAVFHNLDLEKKLNLRMDQEVLLLLLMRILLQ